MQEISRPQAEKRKINSRDEFELCYIRHQYFRRVKYNPTSEEMAPYKNVIRYLSQRTYYTYAKLFNTVGMTFEDVHAVGAIHLVNFIGLFEISPTKNVEKYDEFITILHRKGIKVPSDKDILDKNRANLTCFIKQRMTDLVRICIQKAKNITGFRVDDYIPFVGLTPPPDDTHKLLEDNGAHGYKRIDKVTFKAVKKRCNGKIGIPFEFAGKWYVTVTNNKRNLTWEDLQGAGFDPRDNEHNLNPEQILSRNQEENTIDKKIKVFKNGTKEEKAKTILEFVEKNGNDPYFRDEVFTAKKMLKTLGLTVDV